MRWFKIVAVAFVSAFGNAAVADDFPAKSIQVVVPTGVGGASDIIARVIADKMRDALGQQVPVENRAGANGNIGGSYVLSQPADGYTIMIGHTGIMTINNHIYKDVPFQPTTDFDPIVQTVTLPIMLVANPKTGFKTVADVINYAKANPGKLNYGSPGHGTSVQMALEMLKVQAGVQITHVPYKGMGQMLVDLLGGQVDIAFADPLSTMAYVKSGAVNVLGVASPQRWKSEPNIPTIAESGLPGFAVEGFNGFVAKKGTPPERIEKLNRVINDVLKMPDVIKKLGESGAEIKSGSPNDFRQLIAAEYARWGEIARKGNIRVEE